LLQKLMILLFPIYFLLFPYYLFKINAIIMATNTTATITFNVPTESFNSLFFNQVDFVMLVIDNSVSKIIPPKIITAITSEPIYSIFSILFI